MDITEKAPLPSEKDEVPPRILLSGSDPALAAALREELTARGCEVRHLEGISAATPSEQATEALTGQADLAVILIAGESDTGVPGLVEAALGRGLQILPVTIGPPSLLPESLVEFNAISVEAGADTALTARQIAEMISQALGLPASRHRKLSLADDPPLVQAAKKSSSPGAVTAAQRGRSIARPANDAARQAVAILSGQEASLDEIISLAKDLTKTSQFGYARKLLARARQKREAKWPIELRRELAQKHALATYKDPDLPSDQKFDHALEILGEGDDLKKTTDQETLGLAGAIYKRRWEVDGLRRNLERSLAYYLRGYRQGITTGNQGYTAINAAFMLDLLASLEEEAAQEDQVESTSARARREQAAQIRREIIEKLAGPAGVSQDWWLLATVAEAYFGLEQFNSARRWLRRLSQLPNADDWKRQSTAQQLAALARLQMKGAGAAGQGGEVLKEFLGDDETALESAFVGKVGLALSGGGFRASLYHIGVLAKLADLDLLRRVEVLSCVSGGSIIGAHYYLELRRLFHEKSSDEEFTQADYIQIVRNLERDFLAGVKTNIRTRVLAELLTNLKMIFKSDYSRTLRVGELYEKQIYSRVEDNEGDQPRWLNELMIVPNDEAESFVPRRDNWRRRNKVPILILNATSLNTGHNWQFTASYMGEPPSAIMTEVDGNYRLRRMYYNDAPKKHRRIRLGHAVAASSCVPGLFEPLVLEGLYKDKIVRLVDGGVHDNQGTASLLEEGCQVLLVSDASGQMSSDDSPSNKLLNVLVRSDSISQERVRHAQYRELEMRRRSSQIQGLMFVHLKKDLNVDPVDWIDCPDPYDASADARPAELRGPVTRYGVRKDIQQRLAAVRTDLDSFTDGEAYALMASGYFMTEYELARSVTAFGRFESEQLNRRSAWRFLDFENPIKQPGHSERLLELLTVAGNLGFKIWQLSRPLRTITSFTVTLVMAGIAWLLLWYLKHPGSWERLWQQSLVSVSFGDAYGPYTLRAGWLGSILLAILLGRIFGSRAMRIANWRKTASDFAFGTVMSLLGFAVARLHLWTFDKLYLRWGSRRQLLERD